MQVYEVGDLTTSIASYTLGEGCCKAGIITDNLLYLGWGKKLHVFLVTPSLTDPLIPVTMIETKNWVSKIVRVG
jgi:hypothetical protein